MLIKWFGFEKCILIVLRARVMKPALFQRDPFHRIPRIVWQAVVCVCHTMPLVCCLFCFLPSPLLFPFKIAFYLFVVA